MKHAKTLREFVEPGVTAFLDRAKAIKRSRLSAGVVTFASLILGISGEYFFPGVWADISEEIFGKGPVEVTQVNIATGTEGDGAAYLPSFLIPRPPDRIPPPPVGRMTPVSELFDWAYTIQGVDADLTQVMIKVQGKSATPVILEDLRVHVLERKLPLRGLHVSLSGGDLVDIRAVNVDLDKDPPALTLSKGYSGETWRFPLQVSETEVEVFFILARTDKCYCLWTAELDYLAGDKQGTVMIDNGGRPFKTSARKNATSWCLPSSDGTLTCAQSQRKLMRGGGTVVTEPANPDTDARRRQ